MKKNSFQYSFISLGVLIGSILLMGFFAPEGKKPLRFDQIVREDMFSGFSGDTIALNRAMKLCEDSLHINPNNPEALVWHGSGVWFLSGKVFQAGNFQRGMKLSDSGLKEMDRAVELAPNSVAVRIPRGATLLASAPFVPEPARTPLLEKAVSDYEKTLDLQKEYFPKLSVHSRGELLGGIADAYKNLGEMEKAKTYFERITKDITGSEYARRAGKWLALKSDAERQDFNPVTCIGCHAEK